MSRRIPGLVCGSIALLLVPASALAWNQEALFGATVHGHEFAKVVVAGEDCKVKVRLFFRAPEQAYKSESPARNHYRFKGRLKLDGGKVVLTRVFYNDRAGARVYDYSHDTSGEGCWAKDKHKLAGIDVEGCRGKGCTPQPFQ